MDISVSELRFDMSIKKLLGRQAFTDFFKDLLLQHFLGKENLGKAAIKQIKDKIYNFLLAVQEVFNNVEQHGIVHSIESEYHKTGDYCVIRLELTKHSIYIFCRDFGSGIDKASWNRMLEAAGGTALINPKHQFVDESELIDVGKGAYIKIVKHITNASKGETMKKTDNDNLNRLFFENEFDEYLNIEYNEKKNQLDFSGHCKQSFTLTDEKNPHSSGAKLKKFLERIFMNVKSGFTININTTYMDSKILRILKDLSSKYALPDKKIKCKLNISKKNEAYVEIFKEELMKLGIEIKANLNTKNNE